MVGDRVTVEVFWGGFAVWCARCRAGLGAPVHLLQGCCSHRQARGPGAWGQHDRWLYFPLYSFVILSQSTLLIYPRQIRGIAILRCADDAATSTLISHSPPSASTLV
jgi:hypothetical protein